MSFKNIYKGLEKKKQRNKVFIGGIFILVSIFTFVLTSKSNSKKTTKKEIIEYSFREEVYCTKNETFFFNNYQKFNANTKWWQGNKSIYIYSRYNKNGANLNIKWYPSGITETFYIGGNQEKIIKTRTDRSASRNDTGFYLTADNDCILIASLYRKNYN